MLPGSFVGGDVRELTTYAIVGGVRRDIESVSLDGDLTGDLPDQVVSGGGVSGRSGTIVWAQAEDVQSREVSPWHKPAGWPPSSGDRVKVYVTDGVTSWPRFTGVIDKTSGAVGGSMQSTVIDDRDRLNGTFTHAAMLRHHVPRVEGASYRSVGLSHHYFLVAALRSAGICNIPPMDAPTALSAPLQGSVWAEAGAVDTATGMVAGNHASFYSAPWGYAAGGFDVSYVPRLSEPASGQVMISLTVAEDSSSVAYVDTMYGTDRLRLLVDPDRTTKAYWGATLVCQLSASQMLGATRVSLLVRSGEWSLRTDRGTASSGSQQTSGAAMTRVRAYASANARVAGLIVDHPNTGARDRQYVNFTPSMAFEPNGLVSTMDMSPRIENRNVAELIDEICKATLTAAWWDESGVLRLVPSNRLRGRASSQTVTTLDDITDLGWEDSLLSVRSSIEVTWKDPSISKGRYQRKELFRGPGDTMETQDNIEVFATPDDSTEWFGVDRNPRLLDDDKWAFYNRKRGSFMGVYYMNASGEELPTSSESTTITVESLGTVGLKVSHVAGAYGTGVEANLGTSENSPSIRQQLRGQPLPVIRGFGEGKWVDAAHTSSIAGPSYAPALSHDLGNWGQRYVDGDTTARRVSDFIAQQVAAPAPTLSGVGVLYDPRRQLGDVVTIESGVLDVTIRALMVGISESHAPGDHSQTLTVRIISVTSTRRVTYDELAAAWQGGDYNSLQAVWAGLSYANFTDNPLMGAPNNG